MKSRRRVNSNVMHAYRPLLQMRFVILITVVEMWLHLICVNAYPQARWQTYISPDKSFSIEAPAALREVASFDGEHGANLAADQKYGWATCYAVIETDHDVRFGVDVVNSRLKDIRSQPRAKLLWYLSAVLIGDEDNPNPKIQKPVTANGLRGKEYFHIRENLAGNTGEIYTRGRIFDRGNRIYVVTFIGRDVKDLTSDDAERFLNSFRLLKRNTRGRHRRA